MLDHRILGVALLICIPVLASAQRTRGTKREDWDKLASENRAPAAAFSRRDAEEMDPIGYLISQRKSLKLTDAQLAQLKALDGSAKTRDEPLLHAVDSLKTEMRSSGQMNDEVRLRMQVTRKELVRVIGALRANYAASGTEALPFLDESQRAPAVALLQKQSTEADELLQEKLGGGRPSGAPPPGRSGPPGGRPTS